MRFLSCYIFIFSICVSCQKETINPYDHPDLLAPLDDTTTYFSDPTNFAAIYNNIFVPHCANSGCHDGSFEPDFRTIESSYNTLLYQPVIKNNFDGEYQFRVLPGDINESVLYVDYFQTLTEVLILMLILK